MRLETEGWIIQFRISLDRICAPEELRRVLVAVSGGADSTALLLLAAELRDRCASSFAQELLVGHLHHGLRGDEADRDEAFVRDLAARRGVECLVERGDARKEALERGLSPEAAARSLRYRTFRRWAGEKELDAILLGHQLDDQAETVLLRAVRGAGLRGLAGIPSVRPLAGLPTRILRPLLGWRRDALLRYLASRGQPYRTDSSNRDEAVPRNRVRAQILPLLEEGVQPGAARSLARLAEISGSVWEDLRALGARAIEEALGPGPEGCVSLSAERLRAWPPSVLHAALSLVLETLAGRAAARGGSPASRPGGRPGGEEDEAPRLPRSALEAAVEWVASGEARRGRLEFGRPGLGGGRYRIEMRYGVLRVCGPQAERPPGTESLPLEGSVGEGPVEDASVADISAPGPSRLSWRGWEIDLEELDVAEAPPRAESGGPVPDDLEERVDADAARAAGPLRVRSRRRGDRIRPLGAPGEKSLKEFLRERRVWPSERDRVPLLVAGDRIVWVVGHRIDHRFRLGPETRRTLRIRARRIGARPSGDRREGGGGAAPP